jgi:hypothetical protein
MLPHAKAKIIKLYQANLTLKKLPPVISSIVACDILRISSGLCSFCNPGGFVVVAQHWLRSLILVLALDLPRLAGYFLNKVHRYFNTYKASFSQWYSTWEFCAPVQGSKDVYLLSGGSNFLLRALEVLSGCQRVIVTIKFT